MTIGRDEATLTADGIDAKQHALGLALKRAADRAAFVADERIAFEQARKQMRVPIEQVNAWMKRHPKVIFAVRARMATLLERGDAKTLDGAYRLARRKLGMTRRRR